MEAHFAISNDTTNILSHVLIIPYLGVRPARRSACVQTGTCWRVFIVALCVSVKSEDNSERIRRGLNNCWCSHRMEYHTVVKNSMAALDALIWNQL